MVDPDSVPLLERGGERLAVGDSHSAVEQHLPLFLRARDEPRVAIGAVVHVDVPGGGRLGEGGGCKAVERDREAKQTFHERTKCNRGARQIADITVYIIDAVKPAGTLVLPNGTPSFIARATRHDRHR